MAEQVKVLGMWACPFSRRVELALKLKGVHYEYVEEDLSNKSDMLLEYNPAHKRIPVLVHNGKPLAESIVILEYIDETWKQDPMLPQDPYDRAMARFWAKFIEDNMVALTRKITKGTPKEKEEANREFQEQIKFLDSELRGKNFFGGETIGFVDIVGALIPFWLMRGQEAVGMDPISHEKCPEIYKWMERLLEIEAVRESIPEKKKFLDFLKSLERYRTAKENAKP